MFTQIRQFELPLLLLTASAPALYPSMSLREPPRDCAVVSIKAEGQAFPNAKNRRRGTFSAATLTLFGSIQMERGGGLRLGDLAGSLQIGLANYTIPSGAGEVNKKGKIEIDAEADDARRRLKLILRGNTQGVTVAFNRNESKLSSLYSLSLKGEATVTMPATSTIADFTAPSEIIQEY